MGQISTINMESPEDSGNAVDKKIPSITLTILRHAEKVGEILSEEGRKHASECGKEKNLLGIEAISSPIERAEETAYYLTNPDISDFSKKLEDLRRLFRKVKIDGRLGFDGNEDFRKKIDDAYEKGELSLYLIDSEKDFKNKSDSTYSKVAGDFAEMILECCDKVRNNEVENGSNPETLEKKRKLLVSHQGVLELLLFKIVEKVHEKEGLYGSGKDGLVKFIEDNKLQQGVNFCDGYDVNVYEDGIKFKFKNTTYNVCVDTLREIVRERDELYKKHGIA